MQITTLQLHSILWTLHQQGHWRGRHSSKKWEPGTVSRDDRQVCEHMQTPQYGLAVWVGKSSYELPLREAVSCDPLPLLASPGFAGQEPIFFSHRTAGFRPNNGGDF